MSDVFPGAKLVQLVEWGYPKGAHRVLASRKAFSVIHITGNSRLPSAEGEVSWRLNDLDLQNSATFFVNRDGSCVQALGSPITMTPWANGAMRSPDRSNARIDQVVRDGVNPNIRTLVAIECVGYEPGSSITEAQERTCAEIIAYYHGKANVPINRETVIGHYQIDSIERPNCPGRNKSVVDRIAAMAADLNEDPAVIKDLRERVAYWRNVAERRGERIESLRASRDTLAEAQSQLEQAIAELLPLADENEGLKERVARLSRRLDSVKATVAHLSEAVATAAAEVDAA